MALGGVGVTATACWGDTVSAGPFMVNAAAPAVSASAALTATPACHQRRFEVGVTRAAVEVREGVVRRGEAVLGLHRRQALQELERALGDVRVSLEVELMAGCHQLLGRRARQQVHQRRAEGRRDRPSVDGAPELFGRHGAERFDERGPVRALRRDLSLGAEIDQPQEAVGGDDEVGGLDVA